MQHTIPEDMCKDGAELHMIVKGAAFGSKIKHKSLKLWHFPMPCN